MSTNAPAEFESSATDRSIDDRTHRSLEQFLTVLPEYGRACGAPGLFMVVSESGEEYLVDVDVGACECADHEYRDVRCKHIRRVAFATGERPIPAGVDRDDVDPQLGMHVDGEVTFAATDGGEILEEPNTDADERPDDCACPPVDEADDGLLCCWPCWQAGFRTAPTEGGDD